MSIDITIPGGETRRLLTSGKYCPEDIEVTAEGTQLPALKNPAVEEEIFEGKETIDETGAVKTGTFTLASELTAQDSLIYQIKTALQGKTAGGGGEVGGLTQYAKFTAKPTSNVIFTITNPLGGLAKKVSIRSPEDSATETASGKIQRYTMDTTVGLGGMKLINASTGNITMYGVRQVTKASSNSQFAIDDGTITARAYNATTATWDVDCDYEIEIWQ